MGDLAEAELMTALKRKLPRYMLPNRVNRLERLPQTANGKIDRAGLKDRYLASAHKSKDR